MGVDRTDYIVYGWKLPYGIKDKEGKQINWFDDKYIPYLEGRVSVHPFVAIEDGMGGEYLVFGELIDSLPEEGWDFLRLDGQHLDADILKDEYRKVFELEPNESLSDPYLFIFSNYH